MISFFLAMCLGTPLAQASGPQQNETPRAQKPAPQFRVEDCSATNARDNRDADAIRGGSGAIQHVPIMAGGGRRSCFYVAYSAKTSPGSSPCRKRVNNSLISVFELSPFDRSGSDILVYGTGYGCRFLNGSPCDGAQYQASGALIDAANVSRIVRGCMQLTGRVTLDVVVPHSHADHINPEFLHELEALNFEVRAIMTHADDFGATSNVDVAISTANPGISRWDHLRPLIQAFGVKSTAPCLQTLCVDNIADAPLYYLTLNGPVWFRERGGHTPGATDLVLDVGGDRRKRFVILGSAPPGSPSASQPNCSAPVCNTVLSGVISTFGAHGNIRY